jgi:hypothetical protein
MGALASYAAAPGVAARAPDAWPGASRVAREAGRPVLLFFAHPACPCTRASVSELARLMATAARGVRAVALVSVPDGAPSGWTDTGVMRDLAAIPGVQVELDHGDAEATRFGVATSGQVLLYDGRGRLSFHGGVTGARGHAGDNACRDALARALDGAAGVRDAPVFGCELGACPPREGDGS